MSTVLTNNQAVSVGDFVLVPCKCTALGGGTAPSQTATFVALTPNSTDLANVTLSLILGGNSQGVGVDDGWLSQPTLAVGTIINIPCIVNSITGTGAGATVNVTPQFANMSGGSAVNIAGSQVLAHSAYLGYGA